MQPGDWAVTGTHPDYPVTRFVVGVGSGSSVREADDSARGEIAKYFKASVVAVDIQEQVYKQEEKNGASRSSYTVDFRTYTRIRGEAELEGIRVQARKLVDGVHHSLAVLDKLKSAQRLLQQASDIDSEVGRLLPQIDGEPQEAVPAAARALHLSVRRRQVQATVELLGRRLPEERASTLDLALRLTALLRTHAPVVVQCSNEELRSYLREALIADGLVVLEQAEGGAKPVTVVVEVDMKEQPGAARPQVGYQVKMSAIWMGKTVASAGYGERMSHSTLDNARMKALYDIRDKALRPFSKAVQQGLLGDFER